MYDYSIKIDFDFCIELLCFVISNYRLSREACVIIINTVVQTGGDWSLRITAHPLLSFLAILIDVRRKSEFRTSPAASFCLSATFFLDPRRPATERDLVCFLLFRFVSSLLIAKIAAFYPSSS